MPRSRCLVFVLAAAGVGCTPAAEIDFEIALSGESPTLAVAFWSGVETPATVQLVPVGGGATLNTLAVEPTCGTGQATVLGLYANTDYTATLLDSEGAELATATLTTGAFSTELPLPAATDTAGWAGYLYFGQFAGGGIGYALVTDAQGTPVWTFADDAGPIVRIRPSPNGGGITYLIDDPNSDKFPELVSVGWDGTELSRQSIEGIARDFVFLEEGAIAYPKTEEQTFAEFADPVRGEGIVERSAIGVETTVWSAFDHWDPRTAGGVGEGGEWTHANALDYDSETGIYSIGFYGMRAIVRVDRASGQVVSQVGGDGSDYDFPDDSDVPKWQHQFQFTEDSVLVFDNRSSEDGSRGLELALDDTTMTATKRWEWAPADPVWSPVLGEIDRAADGSTLITYSGAGTIYDVAADGTQRWKLSTELGWILGFSDRQASLPGMAPPSE